MASQVVTTAGLVGRDAELRALIAGLEGALDGRGHLFLLAGEPGIGKTRLASAAAAEAKSRDALVLWGRCWEGGGAPPYWPWVQVLRDFIRTRDPEALAAEVGRGAAYLAQVVPELHERLLVTPAEVDLESEEARFALLDAMASFLRAASAAQPVVVIIDDLHAADRASLLLLRFLARELRQSRVLLVAAYRDVEARLTPGVSELIGDLARDCSSLPLAGLTRGEIELLLSVTASRTPAGLAAHVHEVAAGNPFFALEVVRLLESHGYTGDAVPPDGPNMLPTAVRETIERRLGLLSPETRRALQVAAVIGKEFETTALALAARLDPGELERLLGEAAEARLVAEFHAPGRQAFAHALVRETLYDGLGRDDRARLHLDVAQALEQVAPPDRGEQLSLLAHHYLSALSIGGRERGVDYAERAGDRAASMLAFEEALDHYERALAAAGRDLPAGRRGDLLLKLGDARWRAGDAAAAPQTFLAAAAVAREANDANRLARAALGFSHWLLYRVRAEQPVIDLLEEALERLGEQETALRAQVLARLAVELFYTPQHDRRDALSAEAIRVARTADDRRTLFTALYSRNWAIPRPDSLAERLTNANEMVALATHIGDRELVFLGRHARLMCLLEPADQHGADEELTALLQLADHLRQPLYAWRATSLRVARALTEGRLGDAERLAGDAYAIARERYTELGHLVYDQVHLLAIRFGQGRLDEMEENTRDYVERYPWWPRWRQPLLAAELGRRPEAQAELERHRPDFADLREPPPGSTGGVWNLHLCALAHACVLTRDRQRAAALYELLLPVSDRSAMTLSEIGYGPVSWRLGMLATTLRRWADAERHYEEALESVARSGTEQFAAAILIEYARTLAARAGEGDHERASALLARANEICDRCELVGIAHRAHEVARTLAEREAQAEATNVFRLEADYWTISFAGATSRYRDSKGLNYIATLLANPGREIHVLDLVAGGGTARTAAGPAAVGGHGLHTGWLSDAGEAIDAQARAAYRARLIELKSELDEAEAFNDPERAAGLGEEIDALTQELSSALGRGGRLRRAASPAERARLSVTKRIRSAIDRIAESSSPLADHLNQTVKTGTFCSYRPGPDGPPRWSVDVQPR